MDSPPRSHHDSHHAAGNHLARSGYRPTCRGGNNQRLSRFAMVSRMVADGTLRRQTLTDNKIRSAQRLSWSTPVYRGSRWCPRQESNLRHTV